MLVRLLRRLDCLLGLHSIVEYIDHDIRSKTRMRTTICQYCGKEERQAEYE